MASKGWIKLHRKIQQNFLWDEKPFSKAQAWIDMLLIANHEDGKVYRSQRWLAKRWGWSHTKVRRFLNKLEDEGMIKVNSKGVPQNVPQNVPKSVPPLNHSISLLNWGSYQSQKVASVPPSVPSSVPKTLHIQEDKRNSTTKPPLEGGREKLSEEIQEKFGNDPMQLLEEFNKEQE